MGFEMNDQNLNKSSGKIITRRDFLGKTAASVAAAGIFTIVPRHVLGGPGYVSPNDKLNIACIGVGGKGRSDIESISSENIVAMCDVDDTQMDKFYESAVKDEKPE